MNRKCVTRVTCAPVDLHQAVPVMQQLAGVVRFQQLVRPSHCYGDHKA